MNNLIFPISKRSLHAAIYFLNKNKRVLNWRMKQVVALLLLIFLPTVSYCQNTIKVTVRSEETEEPLPGASVLITKLNKGSFTDSAGTSILRNLPNGSFEVEISYVGYLTIKKKIILPLDKPLIEIELERDDEEDNSEVIVTSTRTDRSIQNTPTRVEVIAAGEISENISMRPGEIKMLLNEAPGLMTQQTSAVSNTANIRIQELDGRYTQVLRDGFPLYSGLSEGLSIVQIAPLDLKQVEIIKGSSSTLYGGGAIAGLINLVSKTPGDKRDLNFLVNGTSANGFDLSGYYGERYGKTGITVFASRNSNKAYDPANISFSAIPRFERYTINPKLFLHLNEKTSLSFGLNTTFEDRLGGDMEVIEGKADSVHSYFEHNKTQRLSSQLTFDHTLNEEANISVKNSVSYFHRVI